MKILMQTWLSESELNWCQYAIIELNAGARKEILARRELLQMTQSKAKGLDYMAFCGIPGEFYDELDVYASQLSHGLLTDGQLKLLEEDRFVILPESFNLGDSSFVVGSTELDRLIISNDGFYWRALIKNTNVTVETQLLAYELLI